MHWDEKKGPWAKMNKILHKIIHIHFFSNKIGCLNALKAMWNCEESHMVRKFVNAQFAGQRNGLLTEAIKQEVLWTSTGILQTTKGKLWVSS